MLQPCLTSHNSFISVYVCTDARENHVIVLVRVDHTSFNFSKIVGRRFVTRYENCNSIFSFHFISFFAVELCIHLIQKGCLLNCCIVHCALLHTQTAKHHGCNEFVHCCMPRPQSILFHIASMANTRMSLSHSRYLQCYLKSRYIYIHDALRFGYVTIRNAQCNNSEDNLF